MILQYFTYIDIAIYIGPRKYRHCNIHWSGDRRNVIAIYCFWICTTVSDCGHHSISISVLDCAVSICCSVSSLSTQQRSPQPHTHTGCKLTHAAPLTRSYRTSIKSLLQWVRSLLHTRQHLLMQVDEWHSNTEPNWPLAVVMTRHHAIHCNVLKYIAMYIGSKKLKHCNIHCCSLARNIIAIHCSWPLYFINLIN